MHIEEGARKSPINLIHEAARSAGNIDIDQSVYLDRDIGIYRFADKASLFQVYVDVPVYSIVALGRDDFWSNGDTWRTTTFHLHGQDWPDAVFDYFAGPIKEKSFPAPNSRHELRLSAVGGACECSNGNHRLVAGRAWLSAKFGEKAILRSVKMWGYNLHPHLSQFLSAAAEQNTSVLSAHLNPFQWRHLQLEDSYDELLVATGREPHKVFALTNHGLVSLKDRRSLYQRLRRRKELPEMYGVYPWLTTPAYVVRRLVENEWLSRQIAIAECW